jgi:hypothetical protein
VLSVVVDLSTICAKKIFKIFSNDDSSRTSTRSYQKKWNVMALGAGSQSLSLYKINFAPISIVGVSLFSLSLLAPGSANFCACEQAP